MSPLHFRRQFVLAPAAEAVALPGWPTHRVGSYTLSAHPDTSVSAARHAGVDVVLVGEAVDVLRPEASAAELARGLLSAADLQAALDSWTGAFVVVRAEGEQAVVGHDAAGLRAVFYTTDGPLRVGSDPALLAQVAVLSLRPDAEAFEASSAYVRSGRLWPGTRTRFSDVRRVLPNHALVLPERRAARVFPRQPVVPCGLDAGAAALAAATRAAVLGFAARGPVRLALTAGWDSRLLLAASRPVAERGALGVYVVVHPVAGAAARTDTLDARVAAALAGRLGLGIETVRYPPTASPGLSEALLASVTGGHPRPALLEHAFLNQPLALNGNVSETVRTYYPRRPNPTAEHLAWLVAGEAHPLAVAEYGSWLAEAGPLAARLGADVLDLFYWEQRMGVWGATAWSGHLLACEMVSPFANRALLWQTLGVPARSRGREHNPLYAAAIRRMWPEALAEPVNPQARTRVIRAMERAGVYGAYTRARDALARAVRR